MIKCDVCFRKCDIPEGGTGWCRARGNRDGVIVPVNYGIVTGLALDPIEKKPLNRFYPGSNILSVGSFGCNLNCPFCQNYEIARAFSSGEDSEGCKDRGKAAGFKNDPEILYRDDDGLHRLNTRSVSPEELAGMALELKDRGNIGVAYTYNEPLVGYEYLLDCAGLVRKNGMKNVLVSNGCVSRDVAEKVIGAVDAANIDLKCFTEKGYANLLGGDITFTKNFIESAAGRIHLEITTLIVPGLNDSEEEIRREAEWIAGLNGGEGVNVPLHLSRFFPRHKMADAEATDVGLVYRFAEIAREYLKFVYTGNC